LGEDPLRGVHGGELSPDLRHLATLRQVLGRSPGEVVRRGLRPLALRDRRDLSEVDEQVVRRRPARGAVHPPGAPAGEPAAPRPPAGRPGWGRLDPGGSLWRPPRGPPSTRAGGRRGGCRGYALRGSARRCAGPGSSRTPPVW